MSTEKLPPQVLERAADWFFRIRAANVDAAIHAEWLKWIEADETHRVAFSEVQRAWDVAGAVDPPSLEAAEPTQGDKPARRFSMSRFRWSAAAALVLTVGLSALLSSDFATHDRISTGRGEQQSTVLSDGSRVELGGLTGIELEFTRARRLVVADEGEAFYRVSRDSTRPFMVAAGPVLVTAIGTAFSVRREGERVSVVVSEGVVDVKKNAEGGTRIRVKAGQRVQFDGQRFSAAARASSADASSTWRRGLLRFEDEPLITVVASLNRYSSRHITLDDPTLATLRFTGTVYDDSVDDWLAGVRNLYPVELSESKNEIVIRPRR